jgi:hypothetical protein
MAASSASGEETAVERLVKHPLAQLALGALGHVLGFSGDGLERLFAHDHRVALEQHHAGRDQVALGIHQRHRPARVVDIGHGRVGRAQIDADGGRGIVGHYDSYHLLRELAS